MRFKKANPLPEKLLSSFLSSEGMRHSSPVSVETLVSVERHVSSVYQILVQFKDHDERYWIKVSTENSECAVLEYEFLKDANEHFENKSHFSVIKPVAFIENFNAIITLHAAGRPLSEQVKKEMNLLSIFWCDVEKVKKRFYKSGEMLAHLHSNVLPSGENYSVDQLVQYIEVRLQLLLEQSKLDVALYNRIQEYFLKVKSAMSDVDLIRVKSHGDYAPYNILVDGEDLVMFDPAVGQYFASLDNYCSQYEDVVHFYKWCQEMFAPYVSKTLRDELCELFINGYNENSESPVSVDSYAFEAFMLKYKILGVFDTWPSVVSRFMNKNARMNSFEDWFEKIGGARR